MAEAKYEMVTRLKERRIVTEVSEPVITLELDANEAEAIRWYIAQAAARLNGSITAWRTSAAQVHESSLHASSLRVYDALGPAISEARLGKASK